jgi:NAD(P)-dependent dehydrogenase (short-subunit alcohol dehydrogenase family)
LIDIRMLGERVQLLFGFNVTSMYRTCRAYLPGILANGKGSITKMASIVSSLKGAHNRFLSLRLTRQQSDPPAVAHAQRRLDERIGLNSTMAAFASGQHLLVTGGTPIETPRGMGLKPGLPS